MFLLLDFHVESIRNYKNDIISILDNFQILRFAIGTQRLWF